MSPRRTLHWSSFATLALLSVGPVGILAQSTTASCLSDFNWMDNSLDQNPCLVSAYLQGACNGGQFTVDALPPKTHYTGPYADEQNPCQCSSVTYNVVSACGLCQNHTIISWNTWNNNCSTVYPGVFPPGVPQGTVIPQWAFQDVTTTQSFNVTLAQTVGDNPESVATHIQSTGASLASTLASASASLTPVPTVSSSGSKLNTGSIAGGVIGSVVGVALIGGVIAFFVMRKKRSQIPPSAKFAGAPAPNPFVSTPYSDTTPFAPRMAEQPRFYDPSDPTTFPASPPTTIRTGSSNDVSKNGFNYSNPSIRPAGQYSGVPEI